MKIKIGVILFGTICLISCGQEQNSKAQLTEKKNSALIEEQNPSKNNVSTNSTIVYAMYNGTATDDGNITGKNTLDEFHLFMANDTQNIVYVISRFNYGLWSSQKIMPIKLIPAMQTYKIDIASSKKLENNDNTVEFYEITKLNSLIATEEIE
jgi:hypothetical protein